MSSPLETLLEAYTKTGHLVAWVEFDDDGVSFTCYRLSPDKFPDAYTHPDESEGF